MSTGAQAQNIAANNGRWWPSAAPSAFVFMNPLTTLYARISVHYQWHDNVRLTDIDALAAPWFAPLVPANPQRNWPFAGAFGGGLALGARVMPAVRVELSVDGTVNSRLRWRFEPSLSDAYANVSSVQIMGNVAIDIAPLLAPGALGPFNPYVTGGLGVSINRNSDYYCVPSCGGTVFFNDNTHTAFAWQAGAGVQYQVMNNLILDLSYRYIDAGRIRGRNSPSLNSAGLQGDLTAHRVALGVILPFDGLARMFGQ